VEIADFAKQSRFPLKTLHALLRAGLINNPLTEEDLCGLRFVEITWANAALLRAQIASLTKPRRKRLMETVDLETKWERYAFGRYANLQEGQKLSIKTLCFEIEETFKFKPDYFQRKRLHEVRRLVHNRKYRQRKKAKSSLV
jgi:AraC-like DNA-binding protein